MKRNELYAHFHADEKQFVDQVIEWVQNAAQYHEKRWTPFLDPRQSHILATIINRETDVQLHLDGGFLQAERVRAWIAPSYLDKSSEQVPIQLIEVTSPDPAFSKLKHGDFLGACLGLGIKRGQIGDLHFHQTYCHLLVTKEMGDYIDVHLRQVHRVSVLTKQIDLDQLKQTDAVYESMRFSVASLRLDAVMCEALRVSRAQIVEPIRAGRCRVNWRTEENPSTLLQVEDVISIQGFGRYKLRSIEGSSKKGRTWIEVGKLIS